MGQYDEVREALWTRLAELGAREEKVQRDLRKLSHPDSEERAQEAENDEVLEDLSDLDRHEIGETQQALVRIDAGTYGLCERCGDRIPKRRLQAVRFARECLDCAS
ncbi:MAG: TraR/DksA family transcriptional regulator [Deltaproteobacteria bacterium]|jgi:RNA polymerase-binding transcription factor DksA|nr:TraR/DksA family transcriptional regulator [Deltaproteobacteria bacterium]MBW2386164.1 TraR/DksA family transcriptional regulator [Deltaproteobacteria bacterium]MBW2697302.1 TraR/DksA family transcriptional regulator [Deltaproteobacteria bacterium]